MGVIIRPGENQMKSYLRMSSVDGLKCLLYQLGTFNGKMERRVLRRRRRSTEKRAQRERHEVRAEHSFTAALVCRSVTHGGTGCILPLCFSIPWLHSVLSLRHAAIHSQDPRLPFLGERVPSSSFHSGQRRIFF